MARILCTVWPFAGHLYPTLAVAHALKARGHEVGIYSGASVRDLIESEGFSFVPFDRTSAQLQRLLPNTPGSRAGGDDAAFYDRFLTHYSRMFGEAGLSRVRLLRSMWRDWFLGTVHAQVGDLDALFQTWRPDAILCDPSMWGPMLVLNEAWGIPVAVFSFFAGCLLPGPDAPPVGGGLPRPRDWRTRAIATSATAGMRLIAADIPALASAIRRRYGLSPLHGPLVEQSRRMPLYLVASTPDYDYQRRDLPSSVHYVGACLWDKVSHADALPWLESLPADQHIVYVSEGTARIQEPILLRSAARGLANLPMQVVLTTGRHRDPQRLGLEPIAANVRVERFVPHSELFPHLSAVVTNGGSGTVRAALAEGLPLLVVPMEWDQFENAQRVVEAGAGLRLAARHCTPERVRRAVQQLLDDPSYRTNARRLGDASALAGGPDRAADLLERLCAAGQPPARGEPVGSRAAS